MSAVAGASTAYAAPVGRWTLSLTNGHVVRIPVHQIPGQRKDPDVLYGEVSITFRHENRVERVFPWANIVEAAWEPAEGQTP